MLDTGPLRLAAPADWVRLNLLHSHRVSPLPSPDGQWVAYSGLRGVGLYVARTDGSGAPRVVDRTYQGPRAWAPGATALHFGQETVLAWRPDRADLGAGRRLWDQPWDEDLGRVIRDGPTETWFHHPKRGTVSVERLGAPSETLVDRDAWGVALSPDGRWVAYSTGSLAEPALHLLDARTRLTRELGRGVHPAWLPDGTALIFARPAGVERHEGRGQVTGSELMVHGLVSGSTRALTATPDRVEMQPRVSADGRFVVFSDWRGGGIYRAELYGEGVP